MIGVVQLSRASDGPRMVSWTVSDASGPVAGARVSAGALIATTDASGAVRLDANTIGTMPVVFEREGSRPVEATVPSSVEEQLTIPL